MRFFVPAAKDEQMAESAYLAFKKFAQQMTGWNIARDRIYAIRYIHNGKSYYAIVGEEENLTHDLVLAIFRSNTYLICTKNRGGLRGEPIMVGYDEIRSIEYFD